MSNMSKAEMYYVIRDSIDVILDEMEEIAINYDSYELNETICRIRYELDNLYDLIEVG